MRSLVLALGLAVSCSAHERPIGEPPFRVRLEIDTDDHEPVEGAALLVDGRALGKTEASGVLFATLAGNAGDVKRIDVDCPSRFSSPKDLPPLRLIRTRGLSEGKEVRPLGWKATCVRKERPLAIVIRTTVRRVLPVLIDGKRNTETDSRGIAHVLLSVPRETDSVTVALDTSLHPSLRPQSPSRVFELDPDIDWILYEPKLAVRAKVRPRPPSPKRERAIPYRLD